MLRMSGAPASRGAPTSSNGQVRSLDADPFWKPREEQALPNVVDYENVSAAGLESSPVAEALAGLRANEARYFMNKYKHAFTVVPAGESQDTLDYVNRLLKRSAT